MALFSDIDWLIVLAAGGFLLFGKDAGGTLRTLGRWYGRAGRLKQELLTEFSKAAELPAAGGPRSIRGTLLGLEPTPTQASGIPAHVSAPPLAPTRPIAPAWEPWTGGAMVATWAMTVPVHPEELTSSR
jgi:hypothetical protein